MYQYVATTKCFVINLMTIKLFANYNERTFTHGIINAINVFVAEKTNLGN